MQPFEKFLCSSLSLVVKSFGEEIQLFGNQVDTARGLIHELV